MPDQERKQMKTHICAIHSPFAVSVFISLVLMFAGVIVSPARGWVFVASGISTYWRPRGSGRRGYCAGADD